MSNESESEAGMRALLRSYTPAAQLHEALNSTETPGDLRAGQLWRASWQNTRALVLLLNDATDAQEGTSEVPVALATLAEQPADRSAVPSLTAPTRTLHALTVWPSLQARLGTHVLLALVEHSAETAALATAATASSDGSGEQGAVDPFDPSARLLAELADELYILASAPTVLVATAGNQVRLKDALPGPPAQQLRTLTTELGLRQDQAMALLRDQHALTSEQARRLEAVYDLPAGTLPDDEALPAEVVRELDHPRWRATWRAAASRTGADEVSVKQRIGRRAYALAARESGPSNWTQRIALVLAAER